MTKFQRHTKAWFFTRIGELVKVEYIPASRKTEKQLPETVMICKRQHALALYNYHREYLVNFHERVKTF